MDSRRRARLPSTQSASLGSPTTTKGQAMTGVGARVEPDRFKDLVESLDAIVWEADAKTLRFSFVSPQAEHMLGYPVERWLEEDNFWVNLIHPADRAEAKALCEKAIAEQRDHEFEYRVITAEGGTVCLRDVVRVIPDPQTGAVTLRGVMIDVTEQRMLEEHLRQSQKMEAIGRLAGGIAHDFNNALGVIMNYSEFLRDRLAHDDELLEDVAEIRRAAERAATLTRQLLAFSRKGIVSPAVIEINDLIASIGKLLRRMITEDIQLELELQPQLWNVKADPGHIEQVLVNLAVNAKDAMPNGGRLTIATANVDRIEDVGEDLPVPHAQRFVRISVIDTGVGMSEEVAARAFEPFFTTKASGRGTGLGLATAYGIVEQAGGNFTVSSSPGKGSTFEVLLPATKEPESEQEVALPQPDEVKGRGQTVLVVEDEAGIRRLTRRILERNGYSVMEAAAPSEAFEIFEATGCMDLLLTDVVMPQMSGKELVEKLNARGYSPPVLFMSGYPDDQIADRGVPAPGVALVHKPFLQAELLEQVHSALDDA